MYLALRPKHPPGADVAENGFLWLAVDGQISPARFSSKRCIAHCTAPHTFGAFSCRRFCRRSKEKQITGGKSFIFCCFLTMERSVLSSPSAGDEACHADLRKISPQLPTGAKALKLQLFQRVAGQSTAAK